MDDQQLRDEIRMLGEVLGHVVANLEGPDALELIESIRELAKRRRAGDADAATALVDRINKLEDESARIVARSFTIFFDLANLAEDRHRVRVLRERERRQHPLPRRESISDAVRQMKEVGLTADQLRTLLERLQIEPVFTAHPTEAKRRSIREKIRDLREHLHELDDPDLLPRERTQLMQRVRADITSLWLTDILRERKPTVLEELDRCLFFYSTLWRVVPQLYRDLSEALAMHYSEAELPTPTFLRFGSWIGGDRDGNPFVTTEVTAATLARLRREVLHNHAQQCRRLRRSLSVSSRKVAMTRELTDALDASCRRWPEVRKLIDGIAPPETYRRWLRVVQWRIEQAMSAESGGNLPNGAYEQSNDLLRDLGLVRNCLRTHRGGDQLTALLEDWIWQVRAFGFHFARLDIRQESGWYHRVMADLVRAIGVSDDYDSLAEDERQRLLSETMPCTESFGDCESFSDETRETLSLFRLLARTIGRSGPDALGAHVISMTHHPSDVLAVLWLCQWAARQAGLPEDHLPMPIVPLFETIDDLHRAPAVLDAMLRHPAYARHVDRDGGRQLIMIGYSDSTKDGGYLSASWTTYRSQIDLQEAAEKHDVRTVFFHGRGGSLGRGGGPAARSILSLPPRTVGGAVRLTEQGEVLAERYDDPHVARRHLEQITWATLLVSAMDRREPDSHWVDLMNDLAARSREVYRELVDQPGFIDYFVQGTPIDEIERLPIGSRPARRSGKRSLSDLRAIPWVFSWTQNRHLIPAWYGLGAAMEQCAGEDESAADHLRTMYQSWPFFTATINNAALALAKADMDIAHQYTSLVDDPANREAIWQRISGEYRRCVSWILRITEQRELLDDIPWLKRSIEVRNPYVDPLNFVQIEQFRRTRSAADVEPDEAAIDAARTRIRLTIQGIAAGLRTTG